MLLFCSAIVLHYYYATLLLFWCAIVLQCYWYAVLLLCLICLNECFSVSKSMRVTDRQTDIHTEPILEILADLKMIRSRITNWLGISMKMKVLIVQKLNLSVFLSWLIWGLERRLYIHKILHWLASIFSMPTVVVHLIC